jgi:hypothetical protein
MSLNKFSQTETGLDIDLQIGCDTLSCNTLIVDGKNITEQGDFERLVIDTNTKFNSQDITTGEKVQYLTRDYDYGDLGSEQTITSDIFVYGNGYRIFGGLGSELNMTTSPGGSIVFKDVVFDGSRNNLEFIGADYDAVFDNCTFANLNGIDFYVDGGTLTIRNCTFKPFFFSSFSSFQITTGTTNTSKFTMRDCDIDVANITVPSTYIINLSGSKLELELQNNIFRNVSCRPIQLTGSSILEGGSIQGNVIRVSTPTNFPLIEGKVSSIVSKALTVDGNSMNYTSPNPLVVWSEADNDIFVYARNNLECPEYRAVFSKYMDQFTQGNYASPSPINTVNWFSRANTYNNKRALISDNNFLEPNGRIRHQRLSGGTSIRIKATINLITVGADGNFTIYLYSGDAIPGTLVEEFGNFPVKLTTPSLVFSYSFDVVVPFTPDTSYQIYIKNVGGLPAGESTVLVDDFTIEEI